MENRDIGYLIKTINDKMKVKADTDLRKYHLTFTQSHLLSYLVSKKGQATQKEIEAFLEVSHPTVVGIVSRMENNGFLTSRVDTKDKRNKIVQLTKEAKEIAIDLEKHMHENENKLLTRLSDEEVEQLRKLLLLIYHELD